MRNFYRTALLSALALFSVQTATFFVPSALAGAVPASASPAKKKNKFKNKKLKKQKVLKGHHHKHSGKPA